MLAPPLPGVGVLGERGKRMGCFQILMWGQRVGCTEYRKSCQPLGVLVHIHRVCMAPSSPRSLAQPAQHRAPQVPSAPTGVGVLGAPLPRDPHPGPGHGTARAGP